MIGVLPVKAKAKVLNNPHFWVIIFITLVLIFIYSAWPWREWKFTYGVWQWLSWLSSLYKLAIVELMGRIVGILFFIPIFYALAVFSWRGALAVCIVSVGMTLSIIAKWSIETIITNIALLILPFLVVSVVVFELEWRRNERKILAEREEAHKLYISKVLEAQENERQRIAQELHDDTIQKLLVIANRAQTLVSSGYDDVREAKRNAEWIRDTTLKAVEDLRRVSLDLRPSILDDLGLVPALRWLVDRMNNESNTTTRIRVNGNERKLSPEGEVAIFRVVQEALNNIKLHAKADEAVLTLKFSTECLKITIKDNGQGFRPPNKFGKFAVKNKLGLIGMQERIESLNGTFKIRSKSGEGTILMVEVKS